MSDQEHPEQHQPEQHQGEQKHEDHAVDAGKLPPGQRLLTTPEQETLTHASVAQGHAEAIQQLVRNSAAPEAVQVHVNALVHAVSNLDDHHTDVIVAKSIADDEKAAAEVHAKTPVVPVPQIHVVQAPAAPRDNTFLYIGMVLAVVAAAAFFFFKH